MCRTVYVAATQKSYLFLGFLAFLFPTSLKHFPGWGRFDCFRMCLCVFAHSFDSGSYPDEVEIMRTVWTVTNVPGDKHLYGRGECSIWNNPPTCSVMSISITSNISNPYEEPFSQLFLVEARRGRVVMCLHNLMCFLCCVCVFFKVSLQSIYMQHHLTAGRLCWFHVLFPRLYSSSVRDFLVCLLHKFKEKTYPEKISSEYEKNQMSLRTGEKQWKTKAVFRAQFWTLPKKQSKLKQFNVYMHHAFHFRCGRGHVTKKCSTTCCLSW